jgi:hypothetical protein
MPATTSCSSCKIWGGPISFHEKNGQGPTASASSQRDFSPCTYSASSTAFFFSKYSWKYCSGIIKVDWCTWWTTVKQMSLAALKGPDKQLNTGHGILILTHTDEEGAGRSIETIVTAAVRVRRAGSLSRDPTSSTPCLAEGGRDPGSGRWAWAAGGVEVLPRSLRPSPPKAQPAREELLPEPTASRPANPRQP